MPSGSRDRPDEVEVTPDLLWVLADECSRRVIQAFESVDTEEQSLDELAHFVADVHTGKYRDSPEQSKKYLHHNTLPKLTAHGLLEYRPDTETVRYPTDQVLSTELTELLLTLDET